MTDEIIKSINLTRRHLCDKPSLPDTQGIYAFFNDCSLDPGQFGLPGQNIYVGLSEKSLNSSDVVTHLATGQTAWSTLRRSLGAILKSKLNLTARKRDKIASRLRSDKYKFDEDGEERLTQWMKDNLSIGHWSTVEWYPIKVLRKMEEDTILYFKPTLDLDKRTRRFNPSAEALDSLKKICREEVKITANKSE